MNKYFASIASIIQLVCIFNCAPSQEVSDVVIFIKIPERKASQIKITKTDVFSSELTNLSESRLDSLGNCRLVFSLKNPGFANLVIGGESSSIYLEPGYNLQISYLSDSSSSIQYSGIGALANNYLLDIALVRSKLEMTGGKNIYELNPHDFLQRLDSLTKSMDHFHRISNDKNQLTKSVSELFEKRNKIIALLIKQAYGWNYGIRNSIDIPDNLSIVNQIPFDSIVMKSGMSEYATVLHLNLNLKYYHPMISNKTEAENKVIFDKAPTIIETKITKDTYPEFIKEFYLAKNVEYFLSVIGIAPSCDTIYNHFKLRYPTSRYLSPLKKRYDKWLAISNGKTAPDIVGLSLNGTRHSLSELKGKVVYIDVWATWCGPCIAEFPYAKKINKLFRNDRIVFLYVSVDTDQNAWRKMIKKDHLDWGLHIIETKETGMQIREAYEISGIPRYILIDEKGLILNADAPRPSSDEIVNEINKALSRKI